MLQGLSSKYFILPTCLLSILILSSLSFAGEAAYKQHMTKGMANIETKNFSVAIEEFRSALKEKPHDHEATLYLAIALSRSGNKEAETLLKKLLLMDPKEPRTNLELGIYYYNKDVYPEARDYFETTIDVARETEYAAEAKKYLGRMDRRIEKRWKIETALGLQYDTNVILGPENQPLPQGISKKSDGRGVLYLKGQYDLLTSERFSGTVSYAAYQSLHTRLTDFNITQQTAGLDAAYEVTKGMTLKGSYAFEYVLVGGNEYDYTHMLSPSLIFKYGRGFSTTIYYSYSNFHFSNGNLFPDNSDRTGFNHSGGITQFAPLSDFMGAKLGFAVDKDYTRKDFWAYKGIKVFGDLTFKLLQNLSADIYGEYYNRDYEGANPSSATNDQRNDHIQTYSLTVTKGLSDTLSVVAGEFYVRNKSNIDAFDYKRSITSLFITARF